MASREERLLVGDTIAILQWVIASEGEPRHIDRMPGCFNAKMWACNQRLHTSREVARDTFCFYLTPVGVRFLQEHGVSVADTAQVRPYKAEPAREVDVVQVFAQDKSGGIAQIPLADVPSQVMDSLRVGVLAVSDGRLFGTSPEHIRG